MTKAFRLLENVVGLQQILERNLRRLQVKIKIVHVGAFLTVSGLLLTNRICDPAAQKRKKAPLHLITLLIDDIRSGTSDLQLAEMSVPLRRSEDPVQGFWADAKDIVNHFLL